MAASASAEMLLGLWKEVRRGLGQEQQLEPRAQRLLQTLLLSLPEVL